MSFLNKAAWPPWSSQPPWSNQHPRVDRAPPQLARFDWGGVGRSRVGRVGWGPSPTPGKPTTLEQPKLDSDRVQPPSPGRSVVVKRGQPHGVTSVQFRSIPPSKGPCLGPAPPPTAAALPALEMLQGGWLGRVGLITCARPPTPRPSPTSNCQPAGWGLPAGRDMHARLWSG